MPKYSSMDWERKAELRADQAHALFWRYLRELGVLLRKHGVSEDAIKEIAELSTEAHNVLKDLVYECSRLTMDESLEEVSKYIRGRDWRGAADHASHRRLKEAMRRRAS